MKCIKNYKTGAIQRLTDRRAEELVTRGNWTYCGKEEWKKEVRDAPKKTKPQKSSKKRKKHRRGSK